MNSHRFLLLFVALILRGGLLEAQNTENTKKEKHLVQFSGVCVTEDFSRMAPVPYATVYIPNRQVGTTANAKGFFSIVVERGEEVHFSALGYAKSVFKIPDTLQDERYSLVKILSKDTILLDAAIIFPWPDRDHFKVDFLAMNVEDELDRRAAENLSADNLEKARKTTAYDGRETGSMFLRQQAKQYYYYGQIPPMNIFSPQAWQQFFKSWQNGDYKKKN